MSKHHIRLYFFKHRLYSVKNILCDIKQRLLVPYDGRVIIQYNAEHLKYLIEHQAVLAADADDGLYLQSAFQFID